MFESLVDIDSLDRAQIDAIQEQGFAATLAAVKAQPSFVAAIPEVAGVSVRAEVARLPVLSPARLAELCPPHSEALRLHPEAGGVVLRSGGTTGKRKILYQSWGFFTKTMVLAARGLRRALPRPVVKAANCFPPGSLWGGFLFGHGVTQCLGAMAFAIGDKLAFPELAQILAEHAIDTLIAPPSFALTFLLSNEIDPAQLKLRTLLYAGEAFTPAQLAELDARYPGLYVHSMAYSSNETGAIGYQCARQAPGLHHVHEDQILLELVDPQTLAPVPPGTRGELLVTTLVNDGMPLLRYRIGDAAIERTEPCACGSRTRVIQLLGRADETIKICARGFSMAYFVGELSRIAPVEDRDVQVQLVQSSDGRGRVRVLVNRTRFGVDQALRAERALVAHPDFVDIASAPNFGGVEVQAVPFVEFFRDSTTGKVKPFVHISAR